MSNESILSRFIPKRPEFHRDRPKIIRVPQPPIGNKFFCPPRKGIYVLEEGPGMFVGWLCTAAGSGGIFVYDGIPNEDGLFESIGDVPGQAEGTRIAEATGKYDFNGRIIYPAVPPIMQPWQLNAGFIYGLTLEIVGNNPVVPSSGATTIGTCTWQKHRGKAEKKSG